MPSNKNKPKEETNNLTTNYDSNSFVNKMTKKNSENLLINNSFSLILVKDINKKCYSTIYKNFFEKNFCNCVIDEKLSYIKKLCNLFCILNISIFEYKFVSSYKKNKNYSNKKNIIIDKNIKKENKRINNKLLLKENDNINTNFINIKKKCK